LKDFVVVAEGPEASEETYNEEYSYVFSIMELSHHVLKYGMPKVLEDLTRCVDHLTFTNDPRSFNPDLE
jgi:hypothetical protein